MSQFVVPAALSGPLIRPLSALRMGLGAPELLVPRLAAGRLVARPIQSRAATVIRVLGARQLVQALVTHMRPEASVLGWGAAVDGIHAATMLALALTRPSWRRAGFAEALVATGLAAAGASAARRLRRPVPGVAGA